jgi:hypothetical protein
MDLKMFRWIRNACRPIHAKLLINHGSFFGVIYRLVIMIACISLLNSCGDSKRFMVKGERGHWNVDLTRSSSQKSINPKMRLNTTATDSVTNALAVAPTIQGITRQGTFSALETQSENREILKNRRFCNNSHSMKPRTIQVTTSNSNSLQTHYRSSRISNEKFKDSRGFLKRIVQFPMKSFLDYHIKHKSHSTVKKIPIPTKDSRRYVMHWGLLIMLIVLAMIFPYSQLEIAYDFLAFDVFFISTILFYIISLIIGNHHNDSITEFRAFILLLGLIIGCLAGLVILLIDVEMFFSISGVFSFISMLLIYMSVVDDDFSVMDMIMAMSDV